MSQQLLSRRPNSACFRRHSYVNHLVASLTKKLLHQEECCQNLKVKPGATAADSAEAKECCLNSKVKTGPAAGEGKELRAVPVLEPSGTGCIEKEFSAIESVFGCMADFTAQQSREDRHRKEQDRKVSSSPPCV